MVNEIDSAVVQATPAEIVKVLLWSIRNDQPALISGAPGIGKSAMIEQCAKTLNARIVYIHGVVCDPLDAKGLPVTWTDDQGRPRADFITFGDMRELVTAEELTICFLDDLGQSAPAVQAAFMQLIYHPRRLNGVAISPHVRFLAATNRRCDRAGVSGILEPVKSRFLGGIYEVVPDLDDWTAQFADRAGISPMTIAFLRTRPELFCDFRPTVDLVNSSNPRTIEACDRVWQDESIGSGQKRLQYCGIAGPGYGMEFDAFTRLQDQIPDRDLILSDPHNAPVPGDDEPSISYAVVTMLARHITPATWDNACVYVQRLGQEYQMLFCKDAARMFPDLLQTSSFGRMAVDNVDMFSNL